MTAIDVTKDIKEVPNIGGNRCFFCGTDNPSGLYMKFFSDE